MTKQSGSEVIPKMRRMFSNRTYIAYLALGAGLLLKGQMLLGTASILVGLMFRLESRIDRYQKQATGGAVARSASDEISDVEESFWLDMTHPRLEAASGWDHVEVYPSRKIYKREYCYGGPPAYTEIWEYDVKGSAIFERLRDRFYYDFCERDCYEVVNGCINTALIEQRNLEHTKWSQSRPESERGSHEPPYSAEALSEVLKEAQWNEIRGARRLFILGRHHPSASWKTKIEALCDSFSKIETEVESLGATWNHYGHHELPKDADEQSRKKLDELLSERNLLKTYGIRSFREWSERKQIISMLTPSRPSK